MHRLFSPAPVLFALSVLVACTPPPSEPAAPSERPIEEESEEEEVPEEPVLGQAGAACSTDADCESNYCLNVFNQYGIRGYCSQSCTTDAECAQNPSEATTWTCQNLGPSGSRCMMECKEDACPEDFACLRDIQLAAPTDLCLSFGDACDDGECAEGEYCTIASTGYDFFTLCTDEPVGYLAGGEACDANLEYGMPCTVTDDCPDGYNCPAEIELADRTCQPNPENRCSAYICWNDGVCASPCEEDTDCAAGETCQGIQLGVNRSPETTADDGLALVKMCRPAKASGNACASDADCAGGEVCQMKYDTNGTLVMGCQEPASNALGFGEACSDNLLTLDVLERNAPCATDLCMDASCSKFCEDSTDCGEGYQCVANRTSVVEGGSAKHCMKGAACTTTSDCAAQEICLPSRTGGGYVNRCFPRLGSVAGGGACDATVNLKDNVSCMDDGACSGSWVCNRANHRCRPPAIESCEYGLAACLGTGYCSNACSTDADCPSADYQCQGVPSTYNNFNTGDVSDDAVGVINYCVYAPGSRSTCSAENDCSAENESCLIGRDAVGSVSTFCSSANSSALGADGDACGAVGTEPVLCKTGFCDYLDGDTLGPDNSDDPRQGKCTHLCSTDEDCGTDRDCVDFSFGPTNTDSVKICR